MHPFGQMVSKLFSPEILMFFGGGGCVSLAVAAVYGFELVGILLRLWF